MTPKHLEVVKTNALLELSKAETDQLIVIYAQGTDVRISMAVKDGTRQTWITALRELAQSLEDGVETDETMFDTVSSVKN